MEYEINYRNKNIKFTLIKSKRKSIGIKIDENGMIKVAAPIRCNNKIIFDFVSSKIEWIVENQRKILDRNNQKIKREIKDNSTFMYLGKEYPLKINLNENLKKINVTLDKENNVLIINSHTNDKEKMKLALEKWYRERTLELVTELINKNSSKFKLKANNIKVKEQKRRYASCTYKNDILFNWRCSMARIDVLEYIVIHEMCHFEHKNHQKGFWDAVSKIIPDYKEKHKYLKENNINFYI